MPNVLFLLPAATDDRGQQWQKKSTCTFTNLYLPGLLSVECQISNNTKSSAKYDDKIYFLQFFPNLSVKESTTSANSKAFFFSFFISIMQTHGGGHKFMTIISGK